MEHAAYLRTKHFASLDGIRCFCILGVIWHHCSPPSGLHKLAYAGHLGVDMFFVLSGFLIVTLLLRERDRTGSINLKNFYIRRSLRIFPIYYLVLAAVTAAVLIFRPGTERAHAILADLPYLATYTANWVPITAVNLGIVWSLATEEQFYLVWPAVEKYLRPAAVLALLAVVIFVNQLINFRVLDPYFFRLFGTGYQVLWILRTTFTPIALGVLLAHLLHEPDTYARLYRWLGSPWSPLVTFAIFMSICEYISGDIAGTQRLSVQLGMMLLLASLVIREDHVARGFLTLPPIARIGVVSYGLYLYHPWGIHVVREGFERLGIRDVGAFYLASVLASVLIAEASFRLIESPLLRLKGRFGGA
jgi:peptidoglycan/LPS O-acetylase OafA/YrhL